MSNLTSLSCSVSIHFAEIYDVILSILSILTKNLMDIGNTNANSRQPVSFSQTAPLAISRREVDVYMDKLQRALLKTKRISLCLAEVPTGFMECWQSTPTMLLSPAVLHQFRE